MIYLLLAEGFEEIEALAPVDFLRRANLSVTIVGMTETIVCGSHGISVSADCLFDDCDFSDADMIVLPGGMPGTKKLDEDPRLDGVLSSVYARGGVLAAICAAPMILGKRGFLQGREAICYPGFESDLEGAVLSENSVVRDGCILTAKSAAFAWEFGYRIAEYFVDSEACESVRKALFLPSFGA